MNYQKTFLFFLVIIIISALIYTFSNESYYNSDINYSHYVLGYKIVFLILLFITIVVFFLNKHIQSYFIICILSTMASLYLFEFNSISKSYKYTGNNENVDKRTLKEVIKDFKKQNIRAIQSISPSNFHKSDGIKLKNSKKIYPLAGVSNIITPLCNETGKWSIYKSDRFGFNNKDEFWDKKIHYLIIGDSFAHGACVDRNDDFRGKLIKYSNKNAITLGYGGNGPLTAFASYREYNKLVKPNVIIWMYFELSDLSDLQKEYTYSEILKNYLNKGYAQNLHKYQNEIDESLSQYLYKKKIYSFIKLQKTRKAIRSLISQKSKMLKEIKNDEKNDRKNKTKINIVDEKYLELFFDILDKANKEIKSNNQELVFLYLPFLRIDNPSNEINENYYFKKEILNKLNYMKIKYIDIEEMVIKKMKDPTYNLIGVHFNENIYDLMAKKYLEIIGR